MKDLQMIREGKMSETVLITGGAGGIGSACIKAFAESGYRVAIAYKDSESEANMLTKTLLNEGVDAAAFKADLCDYQDTGRMAAEVLERFGRVDVLVNNAGIAQIKMFTDISESDWDIMMDTNVKSIFNCCKHFLPQMISRKSGRIVNISSMWGQQGASCEVHYSASKAAIIGFTKALAKELGLSGITVNCVAPGVIDTIMNSELTEEDRALLCDDIPLNRFGTTSEVAESILFLASPRASYITGQVIGVNGGMVV